jgi:hypothetical protein
MPAVPNGIKYIITILLYASLTMYRTDNTLINRRLFLTAATVQGIYNSIWDVYYDWNLGHLEAEYRYLRQTLAYKQVWVYYIAMVLNPFLRFSWILYTFIPFQLQHSTPTFFAVSAGEVFRRGLWSVIRVESEYCTNVRNERNSVSSVEGS